MTGYRRISKRAYGRAGGSSNPRLLRRMVGHAWTYWERAD